MNRNGYVFTVSVLVIIIVLFAAINLRKEQQDISESGLASHILSANAFLLQLQEDIPRAVKVTGYRSLLGLEEHISATGKFIPNLHDPFLSVMQNGTVNGSYYEIMDDATLDVFQGRMEQIATSLGIDLDITILDAELLQIDPWHVVINLTVLTQAVTRDSSTTWSYTLVTSSKFNIFELKDPLYTVGTLGRVPSVIYPSNVSHPYITSNNNTLGLQILWNESYYVNDSKGPSFLMRFTGNLSASPQGIASLVDTKLLDAQDIPVKTSHSIVDFIYFASVSPPVNMIVNMSNSFLLDDDHLVVFDAVGKTR